MIVHRTWRRVTAGLVGVLLLALLPWVSPLDAQGPPPPIYDVVWEVKEPMLAPSDGVVAAVGANGLIYGFGGTPDMASYTHFHQAYDPATDTWQSRAEIPVFGAQGPTAAAIDGKIYVAGGYNYGAGFLNTLYVYDPATDTWTPLAPMPTPRYYHAVTALDGLLYALGGRAGSGDPNYQYGSQFWQNVVEVYDPAVNAWSTRSPMPYRLADFAVVAAGNGKLYAIGGNTADYVPQRLLLEYDPATDTWARKADMNLPRAWVAAVSASNGRIYAIGGVDLINAQHIPTNSVEEYDPVHDTWRFVTSMPEAVWQHAAVTISGSEIYVFGGRDQGHAYNTLLKGTIEALDTTPPAVQLSWSAPAAGTNGWYNGQDLVPVAVAVASNDPSTVAAVACSIDGVSTALAGVAGLGTENASGVLMVSGDGVHAVTCTATDGLGNQGAAPGSANSANINIDRTAPSLHPSITPVIVLLHGTASATAGAEDGLSGIASQGCGTLDTSSVGAKSLVCTASDRAGNTASASLTYQVGYWFEGFLQPINDTAHQVCLGCPVSIFKGGSTVPVKFVLKDAAGAIVQAAAPPLWVTPQMGNSMTDPVDEAYYTDLPSSSLSYSWDGQQYHYNWKTKGYAAGFYWRIGVLLDDGQTYYVYIGLR